MERKGVTITWHANVTAGPEAPITEIPTFSGSVELNEVNRENLKQAARLALIQFSESLCQKLGSIGSSKELSECLTTRS